MPGFGQFLVLIAMMTVGILTPGPSIISASQTAFSRGRAVAMRYGLGLAFGASLWGLFAILGLRTLFDLVPVLFVGLKIFGGLYLLWMAIALWRGARQPMPEAAEARFGAGFWGGVALSLSNPKPALFYSALLVAIFPGPLDTAGRATIYAIALMTELFWYSVVTYALSAAAPRRYYAKAKTGIDRVAGTLLGVLGASLIVETLRKAA